jgi:hypothetical protein
LIVLKSLIDFVWIVTCIPAILILSFFAVYMFVDPVSLDFFFDKVDSEAPKLTIQILGLLLVVIFFIGIYCLYIFRKTLRYFKQAKPFHIDVINNFNRIGRLLSAIGVGGALLFFVARLILKNQLTINLGLSPYVLLICLGLFFMVLSEVFKVAKHAKEENDLTV